jgi:hypothetical protein
MLCFIGRTGGEVKEESIVLRIYVFGGRRKRLHTHNTRARSGLDVYSDVYCISIGDTYMYSLDTVKTVDS